MFFEKIHFISIQRNVHETEPIVYQEKSKSIFKKVLLQKRYHVSGHNLTVCMV